MACGITSWPMPSPTSTAIFFGEVTQGSLPKRSKQAAPALGFGRRGVLIQYSATHDCWTFACSSYHFKYALHDGEFRLHGINPPRQQSRLLIYRNYPLEAKNENITRALVLVHGINRDADNHFCTPLAAAFLAGLK